MATVTGNIGDADVSLDNAATETTLRALLMATAGSKAEYKKLMTMASKTLDPKKVESANAAIGRLANSSNDASQKVSKLETFAGGVGAVLGDLAAGIFKTIGNLTAFATELMDGTGKLSGLFGALKDLPFGLGVIAGLFQAIVKLNEDNYEAYKVISKVGIGLAGDLGTVRHSALQAGLSLQEYPEVMSKAADAIALLGATADDGFKQFKKLNSGLVNGKLSSELLGLGYSFKDINELTASYIRINGGLTQSQIKNTAKTQESIANYAKELDVLARLTGKSREQLQKEQEEAAADVNFQAYLNGLDEDERDKANAAMRLAMESGGKGAADALKAKLMGLPPLTEEAQLYVATMESGRNSIDAFADTVKNGKTLQQSQNALDKIFGQAVSGNIKDLKQFQTVLNAGGMTGDKFASTLQSTQAAVATYSKKRITEETAIVAAFNDARKKQAAQANSGAAAAGRMEKSLKELGDALFGALEPLVGIAMDLGFWLVDLAMGKVQVLGDWLKKFVEQVKIFLTDLFSPGGVDRLMVKIEGWVKKLVDKLMDMIWQKVRLWSWTTNPQVRDATSEEISENLQQQGSMGFASGGITNKPSIFGEAGWEAAVPLPDNRTIPVTLSMPDELKNLNMNVASATDNSGSKDLLDELQLLNKNIATLITHSKSNVDINRSNLDALKGLNGNLFA
jgi:hypothetical protein